MNVLIHKNKKLENGILRILFSFQFLAKNHRPVSCYFFSQVFSPKQKSCHKYINTTFPFILEENPPHGQKNFVMLTLNTQLRRSTFFFFTYKAFIFSLSPVLLTQKPSILPLLQNISATVDLPLYSTLHGICINKAIVCSLP